MDNEASTALNSLLQKRRTSVQLAQPYSHKINAAERAIRTFNNHFVAGLLSVENNLPIYLWCRKVKQAKTTINLLITSITNLRLLVYVQIFGQFDFNATPMALPGIEIISHEKPAQRAT